MAQRLKAVFFDVGETLVDEEGWWRRLAAGAGIQPHVIWAALGVTIARGEEHTELWGHLGVERPGGWDELVYRPEDFYPDALSCLTQVRAAGFFVGIAGNQTAAMERWARDHARPADLVASSAAWGVRKPDPAFFDRIVAAADFAPGEIAYVGDRVDNDVEPAAAAGLVAVQVRRGPWGSLQPPSPQARLVVGSLAELPAALASLE